MEMLKFYKCLCDRTRLRILNLLIDGPLCVCHLHEILDEPQPKISKALNLMRDAGMLETRRHYNWTIYNIVSHPHPVLAGNLACLQDLRGEEPVFQEDLRKRREAVERIAREKPNAPINGSTARLEAQECCE